ncbi:MAG: RnfABCDGE type electron transport complex subunit G [Bacteroidales bacterium]|nr:RnfABCDGE type electron transport complex subunit G [Bacteroidales bacterium]MBR1678835.1 RnfABCDGE type electron transport complex subunit G [Bacteroidales bacterium]
MAIQSNLKNMTVVLTGVCLVCSALLGGAYVLTKGPIEKAAQAKTEKSLSAVLPGFDTVEEMNNVSVDGTDYHCYKALQGGSVVGYAIESGTIGFGGPLTLMVGVTPDGVVYNTSVLSHSETPGLGAKCTSDAKFMAQWKGFDPSAKILSVKKDGGDVDAITASTITSRAYSRAVQAAVNVFRTLNDEGGQDNE